MAEKVSMRVVLAFLSVAVVLEIFSHVAGFPIDFGIGVDLAFIPALFALFVFGFEYALLISILAFLAVLALGATWFEAILRLVGVLPFLCIAGYQSLSMHGFKFNTAVLNAFLGLYLALLVFIFSPQFIPSEAGNLFVPPNSLAAAQQERFVVLSFGELLLGIMPAVSLALFSLFVLRCWVNYKNKVDSLFFANGSALGWMLLLALPIRGAAIITTYMYYSGPALTGLRPTQLLLTVNPLALFMWCIAFGMIELLVGWAAFLTVEDVAKRFVKKQIPRVSRTKKR